MSAVLERLVSGLVDPARREEVLGDLAEAAARGRRGVWRDALSTCARQCRYRHVAPHGAVGLLLLVSLGLLAAPRLHRQLIQATDDAGTFALEYRGSRVVGVRMDGREIEHSRLLRQDRQLVIRGGNGDRDLVIHLGQGTTFSWTGRQPAIPVRD